MSAERLLKLVIPTKSQIVVCVLLALAIQGLIFQSLVIPQLLNHTGLVPYIGTGRQLELAQLNQYPAVRLGVQVLFWAIVGLCAYVIYLALTNAVVEMRNEVIIGTEFANKGRLGQWLSTFGVQVGLLIILILGLWLTAQFGLKLWFDLMGQLVIEGWGWLHLAAAVGSIAGLAANIYALWLLGEAAITADR